MLDVFKAKPKFMLDIIGGLILFLSPFVGCNMNAMFAIFHLRIATLCSIEVNDSSMSALLDRLLGQGMK